jgi:S1/P1 Nuclease
VASPYTVVLYDDITTERRESQMILQVAGSRARYTLLALVALFPMGSDAWAWGDQGHKVICEIAMRLVQPSTRAEIRKLISTDDRFTSFSDSCTWPDHPRQRASEHFLNLPRDSAGLSSETCQGASACVVTAIKKDFEVLSSNSASQAQKLASLKFLGHWVGDIHQPLHVSFEDDRGGNSVLVTGLCGSNLHSAWDTCLVLKAVGEDAREAATELLKTITPARIESWTHSAPMDWANESFAIAEQARTEYCIRQGASCDKPSGKLTIDAAYVAVNTPVVREQLQKAGVRLAHLLDAALGNAGASQSEKSP